MEKIKNILIYVLAFFDRLKELVLSFFGGVKNYFLRLKHIRKDGTPAQKKELRTNIIFIAVVVVAVAAIAVMCVQRWGGKFVYSKNLDETLFVYEGKEVKLREVTYYIMIEEEAVNESALEYDPQNAYSYWNLHLSDEYVSDKAKQVALDYCVRDVIYAYKAKEAGIELKESKKKELQQKAENIFAGLTEKQLSTGMTQEDIYKALCNNELADQWVLVRARLDKVTVTEKVLSAYYGVNSYFFKKTRADADYVLNEKLWAEISLGSLTIN